MLHAIPNKPQIGLYKKTIIVLIFFFFSSSIFLQAQDKKFYHYKSFTDISVGAGPVFFKGNNNYLNDGIGFSVNYGTFNRTGLGFRYGGILQMHSSENIYMFMAPINFAFRTPVSSSYDLMGRVEGSAYSFANDPKSGLFSTLVNFLFYRLEFNIGLTPGYIYDNVADKTSPFFVNNKFFLSANAGARYSMRIWRFCPYISCAYNYMLVNSFKEKITLKNMNKKYLSIEFGLTYLF